MNNYIGIIIAIGIVAVGVVAAIQGKWEVVMTVIAGCFALLNPGINLVSKPAQPPAPPKPAQP